MSTGSSGDTAGPVGGSVGASGGAQPTQDTGDTEPTPGSDNDGAEAGYTPPAGSDDPVSD